MVRSILSKSPATTIKLVDRVLRPLKLDESQRVAAASAESINLRLSQLSMRERQVMERVLAGKLNKVIADELHVSMRTSSRCTVRACSKKWA